MDLVLPAILDQTKAHGGLLSRTAPPSPRRHRARRTEPATAEPAATEPSAAEPAAAEPAAAATLPRAKRRPHHATHTLDIDCTSSNCTYGSRKCFKPAAPLLDTVSCRTYTENSKKI
mmetsp:Transcript_23556/g.54543  ORF Transcript_23556/g.54543 Transcript_23556/m.54543 type:complete len:117 (-) Transcript_23556:17-367(-)